MTDRLYSSAKTTTNAAATNPTTVHKPTSPFAPPTKPHLHNSHTRHPYRPIPTPLHHRRRQCSCRRCCFFCCCWSIILLIFIILLTCITVAAVYLLYHPQYPIFSISSVKISQFNLTTNPIDDTTHLTTKLNLTLSSKNPNKNILILYESFTIEAYSKNVLLANGSFPSFVSSANNVTIIHTTLTMANQLLDADSITALKSDLKRKSSGVPIELVLETMVKVKLENFKVKKFGIVVNCEGIHGRIINGESHAMKASISNAKCKVEPRFKIWKVNL